MYDNLLPFASFSPLDKNTCAASFNISVNIENSENTITELQIFYENGG